MASCGGRACANGATTAQNPPLECSITLYLIRSFAPVLGIQSHAVAAGLVTAIQNYPLHAPATSGTCIGLVLCQARRDPGKLVVTNYRSISSINSSAHQEHTTHDEPCLQTFGSDAVSSTLELIAAQAPGLSDGSRWCPTTAVVLQSTHPCSNWSLSRLTHTQLSHSRAMQHLTALMSIHAG